jgi:DNA polymerase III delta prime subunit
MTTLEHVIWAEKYRPKCAKDCILPAYVKKLVGTILETGEIPNLMLIGSSGLGKTTLAKSICAELDLDFLMLNASIGGNETGIDALRNNIQKFASTQSLLSSKRKVIIFDEADNLSLHVQPALRTFMEEYSHLCGFILTCNYPNKIIEAIHSRCTKIDFNPLLQEEKKELMKATFVRLESILKAEDIKYDKEILAAIVKEFFPDIRHILNVLQGYAKAYEQINEGILAVYRDKNFDELAELLKLKSWTSVRNWVFSQTNIKPEIYSKLYRALEDKIDNKSKPALVIILNDHQDKAMRVVDKGICLLSALTEVMGNCEFI